MNTRRTFVFAALGLVALGLAGCGSVGMQPVSMGEGKLPNCQLDRYVNERDIEHPYEEVCILSSRTGTTLGHDKSASAAINNAHADACACGADAIDVESAEEQGITAFT